MHGVVPAAGEKYVLMNGMIAQRKYPHAMTIHVIFRVTEKDKIIIPLAKKTQHVGVTKKFVDGKVVHFS